MSKLWKSLSSVCVLAVLLLTAVSPAYAFDGRAGDRVTIAANEVVEDDLYVSAQEFVLDGTVNGDVVAGGQTLTINGTVNGNLIAGATTVIVNGTVTGDVIAAGSVLLFGAEASIGGDIVGAGYSFEFKEGSSIGRDAVLAAGQILLAADVERNVRAGSGALEIAGNIGGDVKVAVGEAGEVQAGPPPTVFMPQSTVPAPVVRQGLTIDKDAKILGDLEYTQNSELSFPTGTVAGSVTRLDQPEGTEDGTRAPTTGERAGKWALTSLRSLITLLLIGLLLVWLIPGFMQGLTAALGSRPWASLGWGVVAYAGFFFLIMLTLFIMILGGVLFGVLTLGSLSATIVWAGILLLFALILGFVLATAFVAKVVVGMTLGKWLLTQAHSTLADHRYWPMIIGVAIIVAVIALLTFPLIPGFLGSLLNWALVLFGLGSMWLWMRPRMQKQAPVQA